jgi:single-stranded DNA-binding protein
MQKTLLIGYLGKDPEMKNTAGGNRYDERDYLLNKCIVFANVGCFEDPPEHSR